MLTGVWEDTQKVITAGEKYLDVIVSAIEDPALPQIVQLARKIRSLEPAKPGTAPTQTKGLGLRRAVRPLEFYVYARQHKWVFPTIIASALLGLGLGLGRWTKSCPR